MGLSRDRAALQGTEFSYLILEEMSFHQLHTHALLVCLWWKRQEVQVQSIDCHLKFRASMPGAWKSWDWQVAGNWRGAATPVGWSGAQGQGLPTDGQPISGQICRLEGGQVNPDFPLLLPWLHFCWMMGLCISIRVLPTSSPMVKRPSQNTRKPLDCKEHKKKKILFLLLAGEWRMSRALEIYSLQWVRIKRKVSFLRKKDLFSLQGCHHTGIWEE